MEENKILSYYLNMENGVKTVNKNIEKISCLKNFNDNSFELILYKENPNNNNYGIFLYLQAKDLNNQDNQIILFSINFHHDDISIENCFKFLFFAQNGMKLFLDNYDYFTHTKDVHSVLSFYKENNVYLDEKIYEKYIVFNKRFLFLINKKSEKKEKILIDSNNFSKLFFNKTYPRTGRLNLIRSYKATDLNISKLEIFQILKLENVKKNIKEYVVLDLNTEYNTAIIMEINKEYKLKDWVLDETNLIYLATEYNISINYSALYPENKLLCRNWKNKRLLKSKN